MIYGRPTISQYSKSNILIWMLMAWQAGFINTGGFLACHRFVSHVTGFATYLGIESAQGDHNAAFGFTLVPGFFLLGAMISAYFVDLKIKQDKYPQYFNSFFIMVVLLAGITWGGLNGYFGNFGEPLKNIHDFILLMLLCLVCGIQNGTITTVSKSVIRTTHLTGITTDLGIGLTRLLFKKQMPKDFVFSDEKRANLMRLGIISFFTLGAINGAHVFIKHQFAGFIIPLSSSAIIVVVMIYFRLFKYKPRELLEKILHH